MFKTKFYFIQMIIYEKIFYVKYKMILLFRNPVNHLPDSVGPAALHDGKSGQAVPPLHPTLHLPHPHLHLAIHCRYSAVQCSTVLYSTVQYSTVQYSTVQYSTAQ